MRKFRFHAEDRATHNRKHSPPFGKPATSASTWDSFGEDAESERAVMVAEFHAWLVHTRIETERELMTKEHNQHHLAPFAAAGMKAAAAPHTAPMVVFEFAETTLEAMELRRKLDLLNVYYSQAINDNPDTFLLIEKGNEAEINELWDWFIKERSQ